MKLFSHVIVQLFNKYIIIIKFSNHSMFFTFYILKFWHFDLEQRKLAILFRIFSTRSFRPPKRFCRIYPKCKFLHWVAELHLWKVILYSSNELYLLPSTPPAMAEGHSGLFVACLSPLLSLPSLPFPQTNKQLVA
jgi:hypothetical protein